MTVEATASVTPPLLADRESLDTAFTRLYEQHRARVYFTCLGALRDATEAEDLTSVVFLKLLRFFPRFRDGDLAGLITVVTRHALIDHARARRFRTWSSFTVSEHSAPDDRDGIRQPVESTPGPEHVIVARESYAALLRVLSTLPAKQRAVLLLRSDGYTHQQIAARFGWPIGTAKSAAHLARRRARRALDASGGGAADDGGRGTSGQPAEPAGVSRRRLKEAPLIVRYAPRSAHAAPGGACRAPSAATAPVPARPLSKVPLIVRYAPGPAPHTPARRPRNGAQA